MVMRSSVLSVRLRLSDSRVAWRRAPGRALAKCGWAHPVLDIFAKRLLASLAGAVALLREHQLCNLEKFLGRIVRKIAVVSNTPAKARTGGEEPVHAIGVAGDDHP
jgi:hypothetical protein